MLEKILEELGLRKEEILIYVVCLEFGAQPASIIAKKTLIPRTSIYVHAEKMIKKGFLHQIKKGVSTYFLATDANELIKNFENKKKAISTKEDLIKKNLVVFNELAKFSGTVPRVKYYEGINNLDSLYDSIKKSSKVYTFVNMDSVDEHAEVYINQTLEIIKKYKIEAKEILINSELSKKYKKNNKSKSHLIKLFPKDKTFYSDNIILDDRMFHISYNKKEGIIATEIISQTLVNTQKVMFELVWDGLK